MTALGTLYDPFDGVALDATVWASDGIVSVSGGKAHIGPGGGDIWTQDHTWTLAGSRFTVWNQTFSTTVGNWGVFLYCNDFPYLGGASGLQQVQIVREADVPPYHHLKLWQNDNAFVEAWLSLDPVADAWWRFRDDAAGFLIETGPDGVAWTTRLASIGVHPDIASTYYPQFSYFTTIGQWDIEQVGVSGVVPPTVLTRRFARAYIID